MFKPVGAGRDVDQFPQDITGSRVGLDRTGAGTPVRARGHHSIFPVEPLTFPIDADYSMRSRDRILTNLETIYRETYDRAKEAGEPERMSDLDNAFMRDQLMLEILLDIRDLFAVTPAAPAKGTSAIEKLEALRRLAQFRP